MRKTVNKVRRTIEGVNHPLIGRELALGGVA